MRHSAVQYRLGGMRGWCGAGLAATLAAVGASATVALGNPPASEVPILQVEEDWELVLNEPGVDLDSPQFHTSMSPGTRESTCVFEASWNYRDDPDFSAGGMELTCWRGDDKLGGKARDNGALSNSAETVTWTQALKTDGSRLSFWIANGHSSSWGEFGGWSMYLSAAAAYPSLEAYSTAASARNACITYGANRVNSLVIRQVRRYGPEGLLSVDNTPVVVYQLGSR